MMMCSVVFCVGSEGEVGEGLKCTCTYVRTYIHKYKEICR